MIGRDQHSGILIDYTLQMFQSADLDLIQFLMLDTETVMNRLTTADEPGSQFGRPPAVGFAKLRGIHEVSLSQFERLIMGYQAD